MKVKFYSFYADWWKVSPDTKFRLMKMSNSGHSAWLDMGSRGTVCVPTVCLHVLDRLAL